MVNKVLEISFVMIMAYLVIANANNFATAVKAAGGVYISAVRTFQGR